VLQDHVPCKKNLWKRDKGGRTYIDSETQALIDALTVQAKPHWKHERVTHPRMSIQFFARDRRRDRDNLLTTVLDCLREAGVIVNDNIKSFNGALILLAAVIVKDERVEIEGRQTTRD
jgi:Holliday junction resolvase RusA-like endonuclease